MKVAKSKYKRKARKFIAMGGFFLFFGSLFGISLTMLFKNYIFLFISVISFFISLPLIYIGGIIGDMGKEKDFLYDNSRLFATFVIGLATTGIILLVWSLLEFLLFIQIELAIVLIYLMFLCIFIDSVTFYARKKYLINKKEKKVAI